MCGILLVPHVCFFLGNLRYPLDILVSNARNRRAVDQSPHIKHAGLHTS